MSDDYENGYVGRTSLYSFYTINKEAEPRAVKVESGDNCTITPTKQRFTVQNLTQDRSQTASIKSEEVGNVAHFQATKDVKENPFWTKVISTNGVVSTAGKIGKTSDGFFDTLTPYNPVLRVEDFFDTPRGSRVTNSGTSVKVVGETLKELGIVCADKNGVSSVPLITTSDVKNLADAALGRPKPQR